MADDSGLGLCVERVSGPWVVVLLLVSLVSSMFSDGFSISWGLSEVSVCHVQTSAALAIKSLGTRSPLQQNPITRHQLAPVFLQWHWQGTAVCSYVRVYT
jgi:hypothetical protein